MRIIDFHAHIFPDKIAHLAVQNLENHYKLPWYGKGTLEDMRREIEESGFYRAVVFSTPTKPSQVLVNDDFLLSIKDEKFIVFGSVHPEYEAAAQEIDRLKNAGIRGFKFHPDFQRFNIDDDKALRLYDKIGSDYPIVLHVGDKELKFSAPERLARVLEKFPEHKFVAAHMGGYMVWDTEAKYLVGKHVWFDTSSTMYAVTPEHMAEMIKAHGADKVLFGTDYPALSTVDEAKRVMQLDLSDEEKEMIMHKNAEKLLGM